jgi:hypothetical protein
LAELVHNQHQAANNRSILGQSLREREREREIADPATCLTRKGHDAQHQFVESCHKIWSFYRYNRSLLARMFDDGSTVDTFSMMLILNTSRISCTMADGINMV